MIPASELPSYASYNPLTGVFIRTKTYGYRNRYKAGEIIGSVDARGYLILKFDGKQYKAHRVAWALMTGEWPVLEIDHENGVKNDNRWENLREATRAQNCQNTKRPKSNKSGYKGVHKFDETFWRATVGCGGKRYEVGLFRCPTAAFIARIAKAKDLHGEFARAG